MEFAGRVAIVTGGGRGLGRAYALGLAARGARVLVNDLGAGVVGGGSSEQPAAEVVAEIRSAGGFAEPNFASVSTLAGARAIVDQAISSYGRLDILVNNAGVSEMLRFEDTPVEVLRKNLEVHLLGAFHVLQAAWSELGRSDAGRVVNVVSGGIFGMRDLTAYSAAKGAVFSFTRSLAQEVGDSPLRVNAIMPQAITRLMGNVTLSEAELRKLAGSEPEGMVPLLLFLASADCQLNGETLSGGGGRYARVGLVETRGVVDNDWTPEKVDGALGRIMDQSGSRMLVSSHDRYGYRFDAM